jgi:poly-gamma-glutamate system protein
MISFRSVACSIGGYEDLGQGMTDEARELVLSAIERNNLQRIEATDFAAAIGERMRIFREHAKGQPVKVYINVGGGAVSVGHRVGKKLYRPGLNLRAPRGALRIDSVMTRFMKQGTPAIHLVQLQELAVQYELPIAPTSRPAIGEGKVFVTRQHNRLLAGVVLVVLLLSLRALLMTDIGIRLLKPRAGGPDRARAEPMV